MQTYGARQEKPQAASSQETKKNQAYIMSKIPRVVKIAEFFIPFFLPLLQTLTAVGYSV